jgi:hypothetical protein
MARVLFSQANNHVTTMCSLGAIIRTTGEKDCVAFGLFLRWRGGGRIRHPSVVGCDVDYCVGTCDYDTGL